MLQNTFMKLGFKKLMVFKYSLGGGRGKLYLAHGLLGQPGMSVSHQPSMFLLSYVCDVTVIQSEVRPTCLKCNITHH